MGGMGGIGLELPFKNRVWTPLGMQVIFSSVMSMRLSSVVCPAC